MLAGTVVGAARLMHVTQPVVSRALAMLELRIGYPLFERRGRRLVPTSEAEMLYLEVEPLYNSLDRIAQVAQDIHIQQAGALRIATLPALAQGVVPLTISQFLEARPNVSVFLQSLPSRQIADLVATRQYDLGVVELPLQRPSIVTEPLPPIQSVAVLPAGHPLAVRKKLSLRDLDGERLILLSQHSLLRYHLDDAFSTLGVNPQVVAETPNSALAGALVTAGVGISIVSQLAARAFISPKVVALPLEEKLSSRYAVIYPEAGSRSLLAAAFAEDLLDVIQS
ncbi:UNVERIFIED_ORG: DNA-binding transcriptional LysR family regulator [Comamonas terrigena]